MSALKQKKAEKLQRVVMGAQLSAAKKVAGLYLPDDDANQNPDAKKTWNECSVATRAAIELTKGTMALERAKAANGNQETRAIGLVILPARAESIEAWEQRVKERNSKAIDTTLGPALIEEVKK